MGLSTTEKSMLTKVLSRFVIWGLSKLADRTDNTVDDKVVSWVKKAVG